MKLKVCGLTTEDDALAAAASGATWIGLNFHPGSSRRVEVAAAASIAKSLPPGVEAVALFVNRAPAEVADTARAIGAAIVQLHGDEPVADVARLRALGFRVVRAFRIGDEAALEAMRDYARRAAEAGAPLEAVLVDAHVPGAFGGTGHAIADDLLGTIGSLKAELPPLILAGGLTAENVADRAARVGPWMVDVAGGVESAPGRKDPAKMERFARAAGVPFGSRDRS